MKGEKIKPQRRGTVKQETAINNYLKNGGNQKKAMLDAGYSLSVATKSSLIKGNKSWGEVLDIYLPDDELLHALHADIEAKEGNRKAELELAFKLKGKLVERHDLTTNGAPLITPETKDIIDVALDQIMLDD